MSTAEVSAVIDRFQVLEDELADLALVLARSLTNSSGSDVSFDALLEEFGYTREQLDAMPDEG